MNTTNTNLTFQGNPLKVVGKALSVGAKCPGFTLTGTDMKDVQDMLQVFTAAQKLTAQPTLESNAAAAVGSAQGAVPAVEVSAEAKPPQPAATNPLEVAPSAPVQVSAESAIAQAANPPRPPIPR